ncbi:MAG: hypothetical protein VB104_06930 [Candidatus Limiplasma sp.]|nr:hypothetical protein [Candidatus Limiplasma sp.]
MKTIEEIMHLPRVCVKNLAPDGVAGFIEMPGEKRVMAFIASFGGGWDHVSVSYHHRCPTWDEMQRVKDLFFGEEEIVVQYHPAKSQYVNNHPYCLHLWKPHIEMIPTPPTWMAGARLGQTASEALREGMQALAGKRAEV